MRASGYKKYARQGNQVETPDLRVQHFRSFYRPLPDSLRQQQGQRCLDCSVDFCGNQKHGCPLERPIPDWNDLLAQGDFASAYRYLQAQADFGEITGRICPAPCESACTLALNHEAVSIRENELFLAEKAFAEGWVSRPVPQRNGVKIGIVGSGPAGLMAANELNHLGYEVTVYEKNETPGGLLMFGIPSMKLEKAVVRRRTELMEREGVRFVCNTAVGKDLSFADLEQEYAHIILAHGAQAPRQLDSAVMQESLSGVVYALDFLNANIRAQERSESIPEHLDARGKQVLIVGGGDTAEDCLATALRESMALAVAQESAELNVVIRRSWQQKQVIQWPRSHKAHHPGYGFEELVSICGREHIWEHEIITAVRGSQRIEAVQLTAIKWDTGERKMQMTKQRREVPVDLLILALGFENPLPLGMTVQKIDQRKYFIVGDAREGANLVVTAFADGRAVAKQIAALAQPSRFAV